MALQILQDLLKISLRDGSFVAPHQSPPSTVPAIDSTLIGDEQEHPIWVAMDKTRYRGMSVFS
jgi:hypothetical protein